jgi:hypothetical protein
MQASALGKEGVVAGEEVLDQGAWQGGVAGGSPRAGGHVGLAQEVDQLGWPGLRGVGLGDADQLAQVVSVAEGVPAGVDGVGRPVVVNQGAAEGGEQADGGQGVASALGVHRVEGQGGSSCIPTAAKATSAAT